MWTAISGHCGRRPAGVDASISLLRFLHAGSPGRNSRKRIPPVGGYAGIETERRWTVMKVVSASRVVSAKVVSAKVVSAKVVSARVVSTL
jgi:hypothetical protein